MVEGLHFSDFVQVAFIGLLAAAAVSDLTRLTIPNWLPLGLALLFSGVALAGPESISWANHLAAAALVFGIGSVLFAFGLLGGGDVKLWSAVALWTGLDQLPFQVATTTIFGGLLAMALLLARRAVEVAGKSEQGAALQAPRIFRAGAPVPYGLAIGLGALVVGFNRTI